MFGHVWFVKRIAELFFGVEHGDMHVFTCIVFYFVVKIVSPCRIFKLATSSTGCIQHKVSDWYSFYVVAYIILHSLLAPAFFRNFTVSILELYLHNCSLGWGCWW